MYINMCLVTRVHLSGRQSSTQRVASTSWGLWCMAFVHQARCRAGLFNELAMTRKKNTVTPIELWRPTQCSNRKSCQTKSSSLRVQNVFLSYPHDRVTVGNVAWAGRALVLLQYYEGHCTVSETEQPYRLSCHLWTNVRIMRRSMAYRRVVQTETKQPNSINLA